MSTMIGTPAASGPAPCSCPVAPAAPAATMMSSSAGAPRSAHSRRISARTASEVSGSPSLCRTPFDTSAPRSSSATLAIAGIGGRLGAPDAVDLGRVLRAAPARELALVGDDLDPVGAQAVGHRHRQRVRDQEVARAELARPRGRTAPVRARPSACPGRSGSSRPRSYGSITSTPGAAALTRLGLHRGDHRHPPPVDLEVGERIGDPQRQLVAQRRRAVGVAVNQNVGRHRTLQASAAGSPAGWRGWRCRTRPPP